MIPKRVGFYFKNDPIKDMKLSNCSIDNMNFPNCPHRVYVTSKIVPQTCNWCFLERMVPQRVYFPHAF